jgi:hypothetical protein
MKVTRKLSLQSLLSYESVHKATKILKLHPYRVHVMHKRFTRLHQHGEKSECMHRWGRWTFPTLNITCFLFSVFNAFYFLTKRTCVRNWLRYFSITLYICSVHIIFALILKEQNAFNANFICLCTKYLRGLAHYENIYFFCIVSFLERAVKRNYELRCRPYLAGGVTDSSVRVRAGKRKTQWTFLMEGKPESFSRTGLRLLSAVNPPVSVGPVVWDVIAVSHNWDERLLESLLMLVILRPGCTRGQHGGHACKL